MSGARERASGPVLTSRFLFIPDHSAAGRRYRQRVSHPLSWLVGRLADRVSWRHRSELRSACRSVRQSMH